MTTFVLDHLHHSHHNTHTHHNNDDASNLCHFSQADSRFPSFLTTIEERHSFPTHEYVTSLIESAHAQSSYDLKSQPLSPLPEAFALPPRSSSRIQARIRHLVTPMNLSKITSAPIDSAPSSPPDLTTSKTSRASSVVSSNLSDIAGPTDISHFEDIGLEDTGHGASLQNGGMSNEMLYPGISSLSSGAQRRLLDKRPSMTGLNSRSATHGSFRDLTNSHKRPVYPNLQPSNSARDLSLGPPTNRLRRGFTTGSSMSLPIHHAQRSRSPSPAAHSAAYRSSSRESTSSRRSSNSTVGVSPSLSLSRRTSWQSTRRKSAQELEAEYDENDKDDSDIPDEAFVIGIPLSPRMPHQRTSPSPSRSGSRERNSRSPYLSQRASAPATFPDQRPYKISPVTDKSPSIGELEAVEENPHLPGRTTSYSSVLSALDEDARYVTEALEEHATEKEAKHEEEVQKGIRPISVDKKGQTGKIDLPPIQKPSMMMDPLPMSKEKEAHLSRTRPSHLPPKSKDEEEKHLRQYKEMMAAAQESEKKRMSKLKADLVKKDLEERSKIDVWRQLILPNWRDYRDDKRTRELWWKGIPPACRGRVWTTGIGNELELTPETFRRALKKANEQLRPSEGTDKEHPTIKRLAGLLEETFVAEKLFQKGMPCYEAVRDVCLAYAMYRPDVSLFAGMINLTAVLTLNIDPPTTFIALANLLNRPLPMTLLLRDATRLTAFYTTVLKLLSAKLPSLHTHLLDKLALHPDEFLAPMLDGFLVGGGMGIDQACRVWDAVVFEGDRVFARACVGFLGAAEGRLYGGRSEVLSVLGRGGEGWWRGESADGVAGLVRAAGRREG